MIKSDLSESIRFDHDMTINVSYGHYHQSFPKHWHTQIEIIAPLSDNYRMTLGHREYLLNKNQICLISPHQLHSLSKSNTDPELILQFSPSPFNQIHDYVTYKNLLFRESVIDITDPTPFQENPLDILLRIKDLFYSDLIFKEFHMLRELFRFFIVVGEHNLLKENALSAQKTPRQKALDQKFSAVSDYIQAHLTESITLEDLASCAGFSKYHFSRLFREYYQTTLSEYLTNLRIAKATELFENPDLSIMDVAMQSGFSSMSSFNRIFKKVNHCTPSEFRKLLDQPTAAPSTHSSISLS